MHLFHKWVNVKKRKGTVEETVFFKYKSKQAAMFYVDECSKCGKKRGYMITEDNIRWGWNPDFI